MDRVCVTGGGGPVTVRIMTIEVRPSGRQVDEGHVYGDGHIDEIVVPRARYRFSQASPEMIRLELTSLAEDRAAPAARGGLLMPKAVAEFVAVPRCGMRLAAEADVAEDCTPPDFAKLFAVDGGPLDAVSPVTRLEGIGAVHVEQMDHHYYWVGVTPMPPDAPGPPSDAVGLMLSVSTSPGHLAVLRVADSS